MLWTVYVLLTHMSTLSKARLVEAPYRKEPWIAQYSRICSSRLTSLYCTPTVRLLATGRFSTQQKLKGTEKLTTYFIVLIQDHDSGYYGNNDISMSSPVALALVQYVFRHSLSGRDLQFTL